MRDKLSKIMDSLGNAYAISIMCMMSGLTLGFWYAIAYEADGIIQWALWLVPPVIFVVVFIGSLRHSD